MASSGRAVRGNSSELVYDKILERAVSGVFHLSNVLQLIVDGFDYSTLSKKHLVRNAHYCPFHVALELGYQLDSINEQSAEQFPQLI